MAPDAHTLRASAARFASTRWTVVLSAKEKTSPAAAVALETLCRSYWQPLYAFARRCNHSPADAQDFTQEFFSRLLQKDYLKSVSPEKGRFRSFLLVAFKRFMANERERARAEKRGGGQPALSLDLDAAESLYRAADVDNESAERAYERRWAFALLERTMARLREEFVAADKAEAFEYLKLFLTSPKGEVSYEEVGGAIGMNAGAARVAVHRLRKRYREILYEEIAHTVAMPSDVDDEVKYLLAILSG